MRSISVYLIALLAACSDPLADNLVETLAADPARLTALRAQCTSERMRVGEAACVAAADAFRRRFFAGQTGPDEYRTLADLPPIPASFDLPEDAP